MENLDAIAAQGAQLESAAAPTAAPGAPGEAPPATVDRAAQWAQLPAVFGGIVCIAMPELRHAYSEANCKAWGAAMVPVAERYGWDADKALAFLGPQVGLIMASLPMALPTIMAVKQRRAAQAKPPEKKPEQPAPVPATVEGGGKNPEAAF